MEAIKTLLVVWDRNGWTSGASVCSLDDDGDDDYDYGDDVDDDMTISEIQSFLSYLSSFLYLAQLNLLYSWQTFIFLLWFSFFSFQHSCMYCMLVISLILSCLVLAYLKTRHGRNIISFYFFLFITGRAKCLSREQCVQ